MKKEGQQKAILKVAFNNKKFSKLLTEITDPPKQLYCRGNLDLLNKPSLAVVGSRKCTFYGISSCKKIVGAIAQSGLVIVSGLALGIDSCAHKTALDNSGQTIAVLGTGVDDQTIYPASNRKLAQEIIDNDGLLVSEYPPQSPPTRFCFPLRNRIIAGLAKGTFVVEAAAKSGALITARCALDYNREVYSLPHPINSFSGQGNNHLLKQGAKLVDCHDDILEDYEAHISSNIKKNIVKLDKIELLIVKTIKRQPVPLDILLKKTQLDISALNGKLMHMEIKGIIKNMGGIIYLI